MKFSDFNEQMQRLVKVYGTSRYPEERISMIYEGVGDVDLDTFKRQISYFIGAMDRGPMLNDFIDALGSVLSDAKKRTLEAKLKQYEPCSTCNGTGHVTMYSKSNGWEFAFQCTCLRGELLQPSFPKQYSTMGDEYASQRAWAAGRFDRLKTVREARNMVSA